MAEQIVSGLNADSQMTSPVNSSLDEDTGASSFVAPDEHAVEIEVAETKGVLSCHRESMHSEGSSATRVDSNTLTAEAGRKGECRICQEEEDVEKLETPCACSGSMKHAHRICIQRWCYEKGDTTCEICQEPYVNGYRTIAGASHAEMTPRSLDDGQESTFLDDELDYPHLGTMGALETDIQHPDFGFEAHKYTCTFTLGFFFLWLAIALVFYVQGAEVPDWGITMAFFGAVCLCCLRCILIASARALLSYMNGGGTKLWPLACIGVEDCSGGDTRKKLRCMLHRWARNLHLATDLPEHRIMIPAEVDRSRELGA